ncbi:hypothetical protein [Streptomyces camelliae]|uniref:Uncharacterized protein n=1 Tax=Streptomyces camelliae TaxID=3004093 RepID=A0ABY7P7V7_9ACTN|nr:hypothetical protein [Streptomyces sp. HUAS 2-6]WBO65999.1 hypothetical protein O1G22_25905 [Streptomyces sp. HUAS 2-6]
MFGVKSQQSLDLTSPEAVQRGQEVYDRIVAGECKDVEKELDEAYGRDA